MAELNEISEISSRFMEVINNLTDKDGNKVTPYSLDVNYGVIKQSQITHIKSGRNNPTYEIIDRLAEVFPNISKAYIYLGITPMFNNFHESQNTIRRNLIPMYDDVASIGGKHETTADMIGTTNPSDYIDAGDWFREATVAIRHYGKSMTEYPSGCILALKEVNDRRLLIPGRDYVIETDEYRVTKKIQIVDTHIRAHSTNTDKYDDGTLIYQPFDIPLDAIRRMFLVLGYVVKKNGGTMLYNTNVK